MDALVNRKNTIVAQQKKMQADPRPVFLKTPRAKLYMGIYMTIFTLGLAGSFHGVYKMSKGQKN